ncbi:undecaprenyl-diphosphate phosphatase [Aequorivita sp. F47161]|uniref:Undecaprenyl-diphosphatase n=1 Tax=Aequorivita vitellina TaxID=2874475 RepID=A0A9X1QVQ3_9FLAO|nr:undecaprenyl-diphosphate phosphatase [Aequorivita vitellina]MCG2418003.1 undecaprenyl-diphosphate phosphatase [Aequorivita vitellina]MCZ4317548.1 undecaprenyl-diphosphate phosphatase [Aequorivita viscosa]
MDYLDAIILGIVQGFTEFLPVSSSGHLEIGKVILGDTSVPEESLLFTVVLHFATALSTLVVFRKDIIEIVGGVLKFQWNDETQFTVKIILSMLPAVIIGLLFEEELESFFGGSIAFVGAMLIITAVLLWLADRSKNTGKPVTLKDSIIIGIAQAIAMLPGISRSGATISTSVLLGNDKSKAARFSFLMVVPLIFGKIAKDLLGGQISTHNTDLGVLGIGFIAAFICGLIACTWMISLVKKSKLRYFSIYCVIVGSLAIITSFYI